MNKNLYLVKHGPEVRFLSSIQNKERYNELILLVPEDLVKEITEIIGNKYSIISMPTSTRDFRFRLGTYLSLLSDSLVRRLNMKKGIKAFSYARHNSKRNESRKVFKKFVIEPMLPIIISPLLYAIKFMCKYLYKDDILIQLLRNSNSSSLLIFDHLGGADFIANNAKSAGLKIEYYLNNHKDLTIRPYAPLISDVFYTWSSCQKNILQDVCSSYEKTTPDGFVRIEELLKQSVLQEQMLQSKKTINILHCCSDPKRRPYELHSLISVCDLIIDLNLDIQLNIRTNPMDRSNAFTLLSSYAFVNVVGSGWKWNVEKFVNIPGDAQEQAYLKQIQEADIISSLPSTTLVEGIYFGKKVICYLDTESIDFNNESEEVVMTIPDSIIQNKNFKTINSSIEYIEYLKECKKCLI